MKVYDITNKGITLPMATAKVVAGFPSPASDYAEDRLDLSELIVQNEESTFLVRVSGNSMIDANISEGDILVVDKSLEATNGKIIIAVVDGEFTVKTLYNKDGLVKLIPANPNYPEIILKNEQELNVWGIVTYIIKKT